MNSKLLCRCWQSLHCWSAWSDSILLVIYPWTYFVTWSSPEKELHMVSYCGRSLSCHPSIHTSTNALTNISWQCSRKFHLKLPCMPSYKIQQCVLIDLQQQQQNGW